jgi:NAD(P)-dependent dehydrogenase (short-subunit alcohol dehydrogenase family)/acyl carrier protein
MAQFQQTMMHFMDTQRRVMLTFLEGTAEAALPEQLAQALPMEHGAVTGEVSPDVESGPVDQLAAPPPQERPPAAVVSSSPPDEEQRDSATLSAKLLEIVSERTGYPADMLDLSLNLEADLGIDSIKRVEILGNFQEILGATAPEDTDQMMERLAEAKTLGGIIEWIEARFADSSKAGDDEGELPQERTQKAVSEGGPEPDPPRGGHHVQDDIEIRRYTLTPVAAPLREAAAVLAKDRVVVLTDDGREVAATLAGELRRRGHSVALVGIGHETRDDNRVDYASKLTSLEDAEKLLDTVRRQSGPIGALIHLHPLTRVPAFDDMDMDHWRDRIHAETKSLFLLARAASADLKEAAASKSGCLLAATAMGGALGADLPADEVQCFPGQGGIHGLLKTLALEWPEVRVKVVDLDPREEAATLAGQLSEELFAGDAQPAVGYQGRSRLILQPRVQPLDEGDSERAAIDASSVVLVTGGARGVTADVACYLAAKYQPRLVLLGRSPLPEDRESAETAGLTEPQAIKAALIERLRRTYESVSPARVEAEYSRLLKDRDMRAKLAAMRQAGAKVDYHQVDVRDVEAFGRLIEEVYGAFGRLDGVIHGAGVIEDKLIEDKTPESFDRVFDTKADSAFLLSRSLRPDDLKFMVFFSSVAGCFGNRGQADYAAANEVLNKLARHLDQRWPARVVAVNWGPWARAGMVSAALEKQFAERGVALIPTDTGQRLLDDELRHGRKGEVQVIVGGAGWQGSEVATAVRSIAGMPLIGEAAFARSGADGMEELSITLDTARDLYLRDHQIDARPVLPMAVAMELMAETVAGRFPDLQVTGVRDLKVLQGVVLEDGPKTLKVVMHHNGGGSDGASHVRVQIVSAEPRKRVHYQAAVELDQLLPAAPSIELPSHTGTLSFAKQPDELYRDWLFHGLLFHGIRRIDKLGTESVSASLVPSSPDRWFAEPSPGHWLIDPLMIDSGLQLMMVWARQHWGMTPLPSRFHAYRRFRTPSDSQIRCEVGIRPNTRGQIIHADLYFLDAEGRMLGMLEDMEGTCSKALNRLAGDPDLSLPA